MAEESTVFKRISNQPPPVWQRPAVSASNTMRPALTPEDPRPAEKATPRSAGRRIRFVVFGTIIGVLTAAIIGMGAVLAFRALLAHDDRATAAYAPTDSYAYVAVNTDRTSEAWLDAWLLARDLGIDDELSGLPRQWALDEQRDPSLWDEIVQPAIGQEIGIAVWPGAAGSDEAHAAAIVLIGDRDAAEAAIPEALEVNVPSQAMHRDVLYYTNERGEAAGIVDDALVLANSAAAFEGVVDARRDGALDAEGDFTAAADRAAANPLVYVYLDAAALGEELTDLAGENIPDEIPATEFELAEWGVVTLTLSTDGDALRLSTLTAGRPDSFPTSTGGADLDAFSAEMPADAFAYLVGHDLYESVWQPIAEQMEQAEDALGDEGEFEMSPLDMVSMFGFDIEADLMAHLRGDYALALSLEDDGLSYGGNLRFMAEVDDAEAVSGIVDEVAAMLALSGAPLESTPDGFTIATSGVEAEVSVANDALTIDASYQAGDASTGSLADDPGFRRAVDALPENATFAGYIAIDQLLGLMTDDELDGLDPAARAVVDVIEGVAFSSGADGDGTRSDVLLLLGND